MDEQLHTTEYGFSWGPVVVERAMSHKGAVVLHVKTGKQLLSVYVTPKGLIRVHGPDRIIGRRNP